MSVNLAYIFGAYLLGSIPFGLVLTRLAGKGDIRNLGSGNIGATNVLRTGSKPLALATLLLDGLKGAIAVLIIRYTSTDPMLEIWGGMAAVLGHLFPIWLKLKGGKGVATTLAVYAAVSWEVFASAIALWLITFAITRISSLSAIVGMCASIAWAFAFESNAILLLSSVLGAIVIARHHANITRLLKGQEHGFKSSTK